MGNLGFAALGPQGVGRHIEHDGLLANWNVQDGSGRRYRDLRWCARVLGLREDTVIQLIKSGRVYGKLCGGRFWFGLEDSIKGYGRRHGRGNNVLRAKGAK